MYKLILKKFILLIFYLQADAILKVDSGGFLFGACVILRIY